MNREKIDTWLRWTIFTLISAALVFAVAALGAVRSSEFVVVQWLLVITAVAWLLRIWSAPQFRFLMPPSAWAIFPFVFYAIWRYRIADIEYLARQEFLLVLFAAILFLAVLNNLFGQAEARWLAIV